MQLFVRDLCAEDIDIFINQDSDRFALLDFHDDSETVDISIKVKSATVTEDSIAVQYPNDNWAIFSIPSDHYFKVEAM